MANAFQAYYEHLPLRRPQRPSGASMVLHRRLDWGRLARFHVLDTRQYRSDQLTEAFPGGPVDSGVTDPSRTLLGDDQERWLFGGLRDSPARWNVLAQQTTMAQVDYDLGQGLSVNHDQWDGYRVSRERLLGYLDRVGVANPVVLSGDWHSAWVNDLEQVPGSGSPTATEIRQHVDQLGLRVGGRRGGRASGQPQVRYLNARQRGYFRVQLDPELWRSDFRVVPLAGGTTGAAVTDASCVVESG